MKKALKTKARAKKVTTIEGLAVLMMEQFGVVDKKIEDLTISMNQRFENIEEQLRDIKHEVHDIHRQLDILEKKLHNVEGYGKEIDHLLQRILVIEKHLNIKHRTLA